MQTPKGTRHVLVFFTAGYGDRHRFIETAAAFRRALKETFGDDPSPLASSATLDAHAWGVISKVPAAKAGNALTKRLLGAAFAIGEGYSTPDKFILVDLGEDRFFASDAVLSTLMGWHKRKGTE